MSKQKELIKNTAIIAIGKISTQIITFLFLPIYTISLTPKEYGFVDLSITYITLLAPIITIQLEMAVFRFLIDARNDSVKKQEIITNTIGSFMMMLTASTIIAIIINYFINIPYFWLLLINIATSATSNILLQITRGLGSNKIFAYGSFLTGVSNTIISVILITLFKTGISGMLTAMIVANIFCIIFISFKMNIAKYIKLDKLNPTIKKDLRKYSLPLVPNGVALWAINVSDRTIISTMLGVALNGIYAVSNKFALILGSFSGILTMSWTESVSKHINAKDGPKFISETLNACLILFISIGLVIVAITPVIFPIVISHDYIDAINYIPVLIAGVVISNLMSLYGAIYVAKKLTKKIATTSIIAAILNITLTILLIPKLGLYGAAFATFLAFLFITIFRHFDIKKYIHVKYEHIKIIVISIIFIASSLCHYLNQPVLNIINLLIAMIIFGIITRKQMRYVLNRSAIYVNLFRKRKAN